ncbi:Hypothetical protein BFF97_01179 [Corynebacterium pseudotuberculosis]|nr:Hypothetical protein BFF97_01179 [Corynebacterium pseudotuberculosis]
MTGRLAIEDVRPRIAGGSQPSKAVIGEMIPVSALVWREGHDAVSATLNVISPTGEVTRTTMEPAPFDQDKMFSSFVPDALGTWKFRVDAWSDPMSTWRHAVIAKIEVGQDEDDLFNDLEHGAQLFEKAAENASKPTAQKLFAVADSLRSNQPLRARVAPA